jgi:hypothetical protein
MNGQEPFQLDILNGNWGSLRLGYELPGAWATLQRAEPSTVAFSLTADGVESYNWPEQVLTLTPDASQAVVARFAQSDEEREYPEAALDQRGFVARLGAAPIYGGIFLHPMSSMGISFPVIYASSANGKLMFALRPVHSILGDYTSQGPTWNGIKDQKVREAFANAGKLVTA